MKRAASNKKVVSSKRQKKIKFDEDDITSIENSISSDIFEGLNYAFEVSLFDPSKLKKKNDKFDNELSSLQEKLNKMDKENDMVSALLGQLMDPKEHDVSQECSSLESTEYCNFCNLQFKHEKLYYNHLQDRHAFHSTKFYTCVLCKTRCEDMETLDHHLKLHCTKDKCPFCDEKIIGDKWMHLYNTHGYNKMCFLKLICDFCSFRSENPTSLQLHCLMCENNPKNNNYTPSTEGRVCSDCHQVFNTNLQMLRHKEIRHTGNSDGKEHKTYSCEECGQTFFNIRALGGHRRKHAKNKNPLAGMYIPTSVNVGQILGTNKKPAPVMKTAQQKESLPVKFNSEPVHYEDMPDL